MKHARITNQNEYIATVNYCDTPELRRIGLLHSLIDEHSGILMLIPSWRRRFKGFINSIHMIGMRYPIFVVWLDKEFTVVHTAYAKPGFHFYSPPCGAAYIAELHYSTSPRIALGDLLKIDFSDGIPDEEKIGVFHQREIYGTV